KGFDTVNQPSQESVANFFKTYGKVVQIKPRMDTDQKFKGSYFIQFETHKVAKSISKKELCFNDVKLIIMMKFDYCEMKCDVKGLDRDTMRKLPPQIKKEANPRSNPKLEPVTYKKNCLLRFEGAGPNISWKDIKAKMKEDY
ncbi:15945_t:CDS:2, partial [Gigaspora rosea]